MADVKQIEVNGVTYDIHDATARSQIANLQQSVIYSKNNDGITSNVGSLSDKHCVKFGKVVFFCFQIVLTSNVSAWSTIANIPSGYRTLISGRTCIGMNFVTGASIRTYMELTGDLTTTIPLSSGDGLMFSCTFIQ